MVRKVLIFKRLLLSCLAIYVLMFVAQHWLLSIPELNDDRNAARYQASAERATVVDVLPSSIEPTALTTSAVAEMTTTIKVVNPHPFQYIINNPELCRDRDVYIVAYVHMAPARFDTRLRIRRTWGNASYYEKAFVVVFVLGRVNPHKKEVQDALETEAKEFRDIIQEDFVDSYRNLTYKAIAALKWISSYCAHAQYVLKADDDTFINTFNLLRYLNTYEWQIEHLRKGITGYTPASGIHIPIEREEMIERNGGGGVLICKLWEQNLLVLRNGKWAIPMAEWPDKFYPRYCSGMAFLMTTDVAIAMYRASFEVPFFWIDDVYITGILRLKLGADVARHVQFKQAFLMDTLEVIQTAFTNSTDSMSVVFGHFYPPIRDDIHQALWHKMVSKIHR